MLGHGIPMEAILTELYLSGEVELGEDRLHRDAVPEHREDEGLADVCEGGGEHLLDGQVEDGFLLGGQLDRALAQTAERLREREGSGPRASRRVLVDADPGDVADALLVAAADLRAEHARRDHADVAFGLEAVEGERVTAGDDREGPRARLEGERRDRVVGDEHAHDVGVTGAVQVDGLEAVLVGAGAGVVRADADPDLQPGVAEVERPGASLVAVADHGHALPVEGLLVGVFVVEDAGHSSFPSSLSPGRHCSGVPLDERLDRYSISCRRSRVRYSLSPRW